MSGIITIDIGRVNETSSGKINENNYVKLAAIDPVTGAVTANRTFDAPENVSPTIETHINPYFARQAFDPELKRVAAEKYISSDNSTHVGWLTDTGDFVDVSDSIAGSESDFASSVKHVSPAFGVDGGFYFLDSSLNEVKKISDATATSEGIGSAVPETVVSDVTENAFFVWPSGTIEPCDACTPLVEYKTSDPFASGAQVSDWLDSDTILCADENTVYLYSPFPAQDHEKFRTSGGLFKCGLSEKFSLLPETDRVSWNPIASPDGQTVAFVSSTKGGSSSAELFTVSRQGGSPQKVATDHAFERPGPTPLGSSTASTPLQLLVWR